MLSIIDVIRALSELVEENFPDYPVNDRDLEEGFPRPSYFIDIDTVKTDYVTANHVRDVAKIELYFFAEDIYSGFLELLDMKNDLLALLSEPLIITNEDGEIQAHVVFNDVSVEISKADKALRCDMESELIQALPEKDIDLPFIEELIYANNVNE